MLRILIKDNDCSEMATGEMKHGHKDAKNCDGGGTISFQCEYGKISVINDTCRVDAPPESHASGEAVPPTSSSETSSDCASTSVEVTFGKGFFQYRKSMKFEL